MYFLLWLRWEGSKKNDAVMNELLHILESGKHVCMQLYAVKEGHYSRAGTLRDIGGGD